MRDFTERVRKHIKAFDQHPKREKRKKKKNMISYRPKAQVQRASDSRFLTLGTKTAPGTQGYQ